jgi:siroheme synthase-like protein
MTTHPHPPPSDSTYDYPVVFNLAGQRCLVVGGGPVAARKTQGLLAAGARVTVIAPGVVDAVDRLAAERPPPDQGAPPSGPVGSLEIERRAYRAGEAVGYDLVVTATGRAEVDGVVVADARSARVPINSTDRSTPGTIQLPAVHRDGQVTVAVSTGGSSPALAQWLRNRIVATIPPGVATIAALLDEARASMRRAGRPTESVDWMAVLDGPVVPLVAAGRIDEARAALFDACVPPAPT